jgi:RNA polymerase sigma-70 factor, ECF subfamily
VFRAESAALERVLCRILGSSPDVEDVLQSTLIAVIEAFPAFRGEASVRTWMTRIAVRSAIAHLERAGRRQRAPLTLLSSDPEEGGAIEERIAARERVRRLQHHLEKMAPKKRTAFALFVLDGRPIVEVAALMGATKAATKSRIFWARRDLMRAAERDPILRELLAEVAR